MVSPRLRLTLLWAAALGDYVLRAAPTGYCATAVDLSKYAFNRTECVRQSLASACPLKRESARAARAPGATRCLPIEPLPQTDWRIDGSRPGGTAKGWLADRYVLYKPDISEGFRPRGFPSRIYVDIGANSYPSSIGRWFRTRYPDATDFRVYAFEPDPRFAKSFRGKDVQLLPFVAWVENTTVTWALDPHRAGGGGHVSTAASPQGAVPRPGQRRLVSHQAIDLAEFLRVWTSEDDFVVVKMDAEGAEYTLLPHLLRTGATRLIDEVRLVTYHA
jgi:hypothetical protein